MKAKISWVVKNAETLQHCGLLGDIDTLAILKLEELIIKIPRKGEALEVTFGKVYDYKYLNNYMAVWTSTGVYDVFILDSRFNLFPPSAEREIINDGGYEHEKFIN